MDKRPSKNQRLADGPPESLRFRNDRFLRRGKMAKDKKPYVVLLTDTFNRKLSKGEWTYIEELFRKHSWLGRIECPERLYPEYPEVKSTNPPGRGDIKCEKQ